MYTICHHETLTRNPLRTNQTESLLSLIFKFLCKSHILSFSTTRKAKKINCLWTEKQTVPSMIHKHFKEYQCQLLKQASTFKCDRLTGQTDDRKVTATHQPAYTGDSTTCQIIGPS